MLWHLVSRLSIFPGFLDVLHLFGGKTDEVNEDYAVYRQHFTPASDGGSDGAREETFELCYNFKYVEQRPSHADGHHPIWTTRKIGVYAKREPKESRTTWVLIQPGRKSYLDRVTKRLGKAGKAHAHDQEIHLLLMKSASQNWTEHIDALDVEFRMLDTKVFMWRPGVTNALVDEYLQSGLVMPDSQRIQHYKVKLHQLLHALDINYANIESLRRGMEEFQRQGNYTSRDEHQKYDRELQELLFQTMQHKVRVMHLIECAQGLLSLVCTLIPYVFARKENSLMLKLSEKATEYAKSMNMITIMCMLYLPPSLVAAIFGMTDIFHTRSSSLGPVIGMFAAATTGLFALTFTVWALWEYTRRNFSSLRDEEMNVTD
ncbi:hypothetical protein BZA05DRAFT_47845 [Tricharina praecox]|uniref:uncharacterized protein n=1 Tax=Tricharina praecox TaxID=43433 RepID=UPI00222039CA|nr:uncharacterized protein BZA05DRAFT_47845 [Tricharina praecox]KAI5851948.1 hypothetical protein BZA05DRAFT_47845 [Tricharina praecox]